LLNQSKILFCLVFSLFHESFSLLRRQAFDDFFSSDL